MVERTLDSIYHLSIVWMSSVVVGRKLQAQNKSRVAPHFRFDVSHLDAYRLFLMALERP